MTLPRLIALAGVAAFLAAMVYVGYVNEQLKGAINPWNRAIVMIGFVVGAGAVCRSLITAAERLRDKRRSGGS